MPSGLRTVVQQSPPQWGAGLDTGAQQEPALRGAERYEPLDEAGRYGRGVLIAEGGMGAVYLAHDTVLDRLVAVRLLRPEFTHAGARFRDEARIAGRFQHLSVRIRLIVQCV